MILCQRPRHISDPRRTTNSSQRLSSVWFAHLPLSYLFGEYQDFFFQVLYLLCFANAGQFVREGSFASRDYRLRNQARLVAWCTASTTTTPPTPQQNDPAKASQMLVAVSTVTSSANTQVDIKILASLATRLILTPLPWRTLVLPPSPHSAPKSTCPIRSRTTSQDLL